MSHLEIPTCPLFCRDGFLEVLTHTHTHPHRRLRRAEGFGCGPSKAAVHYRVFLIVGSLALSVDGKGGASPTSSIDVLFKKVTLFFLVN